MGCLWGRHYQFPTWRKGTKWAHCLAHCPHRWLDVPIKHVLICTLDDGHCVHTDNTGRIISGVGRGIAKQKTENPELVTITMSIYKVNLPVPKDSQSWALTQCFSSSLQHRKLFMECIWPMAKHIPSTGLLISLPYELSFAVVAHLHKCKGLKQHQCVLVQLRKSKARPQAEL